MQELKDKIVNEGTVIGTQIVKVDHFLNHMLDVAFLERAGREFGKRFAGCRVDKILTVEASGIAVASMASPNFGYAPVLFAKKTAPSTMIEGFLEADARSFTKGTVSKLKISKELLRPGEHVLILDDFIAHGEAAFALAEIVRKAGCTVTGIGSVIEKGFQGGGKRLREAGFNVQSLAVISDIKDGVITFA